MDKTSYTIFKTFFKVGTLLLGGGYVILPLLTNELVDKRKWITSEELCEYFAISTSLPGVIAANISVFVGNKLLGLKGSIAAVVGLILPAFLAIVLLATILSEIVAKAFVQNIFWGVGIGVILLLYLAVKEMWKKAIVYKFSWIVYIVSLLLTLSGKIPLALIVIAALCTGIIHQIVSDRYFSTRENEDEVKI